MKSFLLGQVAPRLRARGKEAFVRSLGSRATVIDVGCGNNSPLRAKQVNPSIRYIGLDVGDYNQRIESVREADEYVITTAADFAAAVERLAGSADAVVSSHNLEHCDEPERVLVAMCRALKAGGRMYLSFPSTASQDFPRRPRNTLNFHDDPSHHGQPPDLRATLATLCSNGLRIDFLAERYRPFVPAALGALLEPVSVLTGKSMPLGSTWALYGFETVIWAGRD